VGEGDPSTLGVEKHLDYAPHVKDSMIQEWENFNSSLKPDTITGDLHLGVILIQFSDWQTNPYARGGYSLVPQWYGMPFTADQYDSLFFSTGWYFTHPDSIFSPDSEKVYGSLNDFYRINSSNLVRIKGAILNPDTIINGERRYIWYTAQNTKDYYAFGPGTGWGLFEEAESLAIENGFNPDTFDYLAMVYAGNVVYDSRLHPQALGNKYFTSEKDFRLYFSHIGVHCHEFGHLLGLPDLYYVEGVGKTSNDIGKWGIMGTGVYNGPTNVDASCPTPPNPRCKESLGWGIFHEIPPDTDGIRVVLKPSAQFNEYWKIKITDSLSNCFLYIENKYTTGYNAYIPGWQQPDFQGGIMIWYSKSYYPPTSGYGYCDVVEADSSDDIRDQKNEGERWDIFDGDTSRDEISAYTQVYNTDFYYQGEWYPSFVAVLDITPVETLIQDSLGFTKATLWRQYIDTTKFKVKLRDYSFFRISLNGERQKVSKNERGYLEIVLWNYWAGMTNVRVKVKGLYGVNVIDSIANYGDMSANEIKSNLEIPDSLILVPTCEIGDSFEIKVLVLSNEYMDSFNLKFLVELSSLAGYPLKAGTGYAEVFCYDIDNDGKDEILTYSQDTLRIYKGENGNLYMEKVLDPIERISSVMVQDINLDGIFEIIVAGHRGSMITITEYLYVLNNQGNILFMDSVNTPEVHLKVQLSTNDLDFDTDFEILWGIEQIKKIRVYRYPYSFLFSIDANIPFSVADLNRDAKPEIAAISTDSKLSIRDNQGNLIWQDDIEWNEVNQIITGDMDIDGDMEIIVAGEIDTVNKILKYEYSGTIPPFWTSTVLFERQGEITPPACIKETQEKIAIIFQVNDTIFYISSEGNVLRSYPIREQEFTPFAQIRASEKDKVIYADARHIFGYSPAYNIFVKVASSWNGNSENVFIADINGDYFYEIVFQDGGGLLEVRKTDADVKFIPEWQTRFCNLYNNLNYMQSFMGTKTTSFSLSGKVIIPGDLTVSSPETLRIISPSLIYFPPFDLSNSGYDTLRSELKIEGNLLTYGNKKIFFESFSDAPGTSDWYGIIGKGNSYMNLKNAEIKNAYKGIYLVGNKFQTSSKLVADNISFKDIYLYGVQGLFSDFDIRNCEFYYIPYGIYVQTSKGIIRNNIFSVIGSKGIYLETNYGEIVVDSNRISSGKNSTYGIYCKNIDTLVVIRDNEINDWTWGIFLNGSSPYIKYNTITSNYYDIICYSYSSPFVARNEITNSPYGVYTYLDSYPLLGKDEVSGSGYNSIYGHRYYDVWNRCPDTLYAENNWWGGPPDTSKIEGPVDYIPYLRNPPGGIQGFSLYIPKIFKLNKIYPNPFREKAIIRFQIPEECHLEMEIYDVMGRKIKQIYKGKIKPGFYKLSWDGRDDKNKRVAQGVYFLRFYTKKYKSFQKMIILK